jgi:hypothetical protein
MYNHKIKSVRIACFNFGLELKSGLKSIGTVYSLDAFFPKNTCLKKEVHLKRSFFLKVFSDYFLTKRFVSGSGAIFKSWVDFNEGSIRSGALFKSTPSTLFLKNFNISAEKMLGLCLNLNFVSVSTILLHKFVKQSIEP